LKGAGWGRILLVLLALGFAAGQATEVKVMTWNIKRAVGANSPNPEQAPYVAKIVNYLEPDVWVIQELGGDDPGWNQAAQLAALESFINSSVTIFGANPQLGVDYFVYVNAMSDGWSSCAIVSRYPFLAMDEVDIDSPGRGLAMGWIEVPETSGLGVFTAHFKAGGSTSDAEKRQTNAELTAAAVAQWTNDHPYCAFVFGADMNENEDADLDPLYTIGATLPNGHVYHPISTVLSAGFEDPLPLDALGGKKSWRVNSLTNRFDYGLVSDYGGGREEAETLSADMFNTRRFASGELPPGFYTSDSENASDHVPIVLTLDANPQPPVDLIGLVSLELYEGGGGQESVLEFREPGTTNVLYAAPVTRNVGGYIFVDDAPQGTYDLALKFDNWLRQVVPSVELTPPSVNVSFSLKNGDADNSNGVDLLDVNTVLSAFGAAGGAGDLNWDASVDVLDLNITVTNFGVTGDT
jgi:endonuclease/exonuclease/phosphatase family metal-dependent hydrolase